MLSFGYRNAGNPLPLTSIGSDPNANAGSSLNQELPFPSKLKLRGQMAQQEASAAFLEYQVTELRVGSRVKQISSYVLRRISRTASPTPERFSNFISLNSRDITIP